MNICYEQMFVSLEQVERYFFEHANGRRARERILELERAGLLTKTKVYGEKAFSLIRLSKEGFRLVQAENEFRLNFRPHVDFFTADHDLKLIDIRFRLQQVWTNYAWIPERAIKQADLREIPDALCIFKTGKKIAIELENSQKAYDRLQRLASRWNQTEVDLVLYFATTPAILKKLKEVIISIESEVCLGVIDFHAFLKAWPDAWTKGGSLDVFGK